MNMSRKSPTAASTITITSTTITITVTITTIARRTAITAIGQVILMRYSATNYEGLD